MDSALSAFTKALEGGNDYARWNAARELVRHYLKKDKWEEIEKLLRHKNAKVREGTAHELRQAGAGAEGASLSNISPLVPGLIKSLKDESVEVRRSAADALSLVSEVTGDVAYWEYHYNKDLDLTPAIPFLTKALEDDDSMVRWYAAETLEHAAESGLDITDSIPVLTNALEDKEELTRRYAAGALANAACLGQDITFALSALRKTLKDSYDWARDNSVRAFIFHYLRQGNWKKVEESLESKDVEDRKNAARALQIAAWNKVDVSPLVPELSKALKDEDNDVRWDASRAVRYAVNNGVDISSAIPNLIHALSDPYWIYIDNTEKHIIRRNASAALTAYYINKKDWENVERLLKHKDDQVKTGAGIALNNAVEKSKARSHKARSHKAHRS